MERECREGTNEANFSGRIRFIRQFAQFALKEIRTLRKPPPKPKRPPMRGGRWYNLGEVIMMPKEGIEPSFPEGTRF